MSPARAASGITPLPCDGSSGASIFLYGGSARILSQTTIPVCASGAVTVSFHSTPQACSAGGPCGYAGVETWRPTGGGLLSLLSVRHSGQDASDASLVLGFGAPLSETVTRTTVSGHSSSCHDRNGQFAGFLSPQVRAGRLVIGLGGSGASTGTGQAPLLGTRCAGPLDADVAPALPVGSFALAEVRRGHLSLDLSGSHPFASRDFAGEVSSDLVLNLGRARVGPPSGGAPGRGERIRNLIESYRVQRLRGEITAGITATSQLACRRLAACGTHGTIHLDARAVGRGSLFVSANGPAHRPVADFLAALGRVPGGDRPGIVVSGGGDSSVLGRVNAALRAPARCRDRIAVTMLGLRLQARRDRMQVALSGAGVQPDPLRTRCPGPALGSRWLAAGSVPLIAFGRPTVMVTLHGLRFTAGPYRLRGAGSFSVILRRTGQSTQIYRLGA